MIFTILSGLVFFSIVFSFGFYFAKFIFRTSISILLIPSSIVLGLGFYVFFVNLISYLIPLDLSIYIVLLFFLSSIFLLKKNKTDDNDTFSYSLINSRQKKLLYTTVISITLLSGVVAFKSLALDNLLLMHLPFASTISSGNFPVLDPSAPDHRFAYHYSADLLSAIIHSVSGIPIEFAYDFQVMIFAGSLFLIIFCTLFEILGNFRQSYVGAFLFMYGCGTQWMYFFTKGISSIYSNFFLQSDIAHPWKFVAEIAYPYLNTSFIYGMNNHSLAIGMPILFISLFIFYRAINENNNKYFIIQTVVGSLMFGYLALNLETYFTIIAIAFVCLIFLYFFRNKTSIYKDLFNDSTNKLIFVTLSYLIIGSILAFNQGGILSNILNTKDRDHFRLVNSFKDFTVLDLSVAPNRILDPSIPVNKDDLTHIFSFDFFVQFGFTIIFSVFAVIFYRRNLKLSLLSLIAFGSFIIPFIFRYPARPWEMTRFFTFSVPLFSMLIGVYLSNKYYADSISKVKKILIVVVIVSIIGSGVLSQLLFSISSLDRFGKIDQKFFVLPEKPQLIDKKSFDWIKVNTNIKDRFFPYDVDFIRETGRFAVGAPRFITFSQRNYERALYKDIQDNCTIDSIKKLKITYFYVKNGNDGFKRCNFDKYFSLVHKEDLYGQSRIIYKVNYR